MQTAGVGRLVVDLELHDLGSFALEDPQHGEPLQGARGLAGPCQHDDAELVEHLGDVVGVHALDVETYDATTIGHVVRPDDPDAPLELECEPRQGVGRQRVFVTHDVSEAVYLADTVYVLSNRPAHILHRVDVPFFEVRDIGLKSSSEFRAIEKRLLEMLYAPVAQPA